MIRLTLLALFISSISLAQFTENPTYPKGYFRNPLGIPISLSGNFGELRPNHYHMGLDLKTERRENLSVYAAAEGYISRIKVESGGFGRAIYVTHPNGFTTVYCHLNNFFPDLENWVKSLQYQKESWYLNDEIPADKFPVKKGQLLAYSGNTGGSQAPHLHFEIRRTVDEVNLNPMLFGFPLTDNTLPTILRVAIYDRNLSVFEQNPRVLSVTNKGNGNYAAPLQTVNTSKISLALTTYDTHTGSSNLNGVYEAVLYDELEAIVGFRMDQISYEATRYLNAHIDYKTKQRGGPYLQHLSELPGYMHSIYTRFNGDGVIELSDGLIHELSIVVKDAFGNASKVKVPVKYSGNQSTKITLSGKRFYPLMLDIFESEDCEFIIGERALYDSVSISYKKQAGIGSGTISSLHTIGSLSVPLQDAMMVRIKVADTINEADKSKIVMQRIAGTRKEVQKVSWDENWAMAGFRDFGSFQLVVDNIAPEIIPVGFKDGSNLSAASRVVFTVNDNLGKWKVTRTELDGSWIRFTNDKGRNFIYTFDERFSAGEHELRVVAVDEAGNETEAKWKVRR